MNNKKCLIVTFVGGSIVTHPRFNSSDHWRLTKQDRLYDTHVIAYNDHVVEEGTFDTVEYRKGFKPSHIKYVLETIDLSRYEYVGFFDEDIVTTKKDVNKALSIANQYDLKFFRLNCDLESSNQPEVIEIQRLECDGFFIHTSKISYFLDILNYYSFVHGWGLFYVLPTILECKPYQINNCRMINVKNSTRYSTHEASKEMIDTLDEIFPSYMLEKRSQAIDPAQPSFYKPHYGTMRQTVNATFKLAKKVRSVVNPDWGSGMVENVDCNNMTVTAKFKHGRETLLWGDTAYFIPNAETPEKYRIAIGRLIENNEV